ncbi:MAG: MbcA/ParS/Xre antitoxin family protein [Archangium sp.]|nr:MbcA/ParS/Xre antitoxin family protein [Archangium sp.]
MNCAVPVLRLRRAKLIHVGTRVFGDEAKAREWARTPQPALDGAIPDELADTLEGLERALAELESLLPQVG